MGINKCLRGNWKLLLHATIIMRAYTFETMIIPGLGKIFIVPNIKFPLLEQTSNQILFFFLILSSWHLHPDILLYYFDCLKTMQLVTEY